MKILILLFATVFTVVAGVLKESDLSPLESALGTEKVSGKIDYNSLRHHSAVIKFLNACGNDADNKYKSAEAWLLRGEPLAEMQDVNLNKLSRQVRDKLLDVLSGLVWNKDRVRAREIAGKIKDPVFQEEVLNLFDVMEGKGPSKPIPAK